jgi:hypothetical protein
MKENAINGFCGFYCKYPNDISKQKGCKHFGCVDQISEKCWYNAWGHYCNSKEAIKEWHDKNWENEERRILEFCTT